MQSVLVNVLYNKKKSTNSWQPCLMSFDVNSSNLLLVQFNCALSLLILCHLNISITERCVLKYSTKMIDISISFILQFWFSHIPCN